jgi:hypothetical protein
MILKLKTISAFLALVPLYGVFATRHIHPGGNKDNVRSYHSGYIFPFDNLHGATVSWGVYVLELPPDSNDGGPVRDDSQCCY